ncbi:hypothetical protein KIW84_033730 [Lathyrus oleraceus]|uniref:Uncharacterized protein n=1 Tax=Pisum sativum TaxID=3888 RepID=A0A9D4XZC0_PEA|nr:hypothetical protein KIW84_033730 [Pisum sativum]
MIKSSSRVGWPYKEFQDILAQSGRIIVGDMDAIAHSTKKSLGHAIVILLLCSKAEVENLGGSKMVNPTRCLDPFWLKENIVARVDQNVGVSGTRRPLADDA